MPRAEPIWRSIELVPEARPETSGGTSARTTLVSWAVAKPTPMPYTNNGIPSMSPVTVVEMRSVVTTIPMASRAMPMVTTRRGP